MLAGLEKKERTGRAKAMSTYYSKAYDLMTSPEARKAFHIQSEPEKLRVYANKARNDWIPTTLSFEGAVEVGTYRNPLENSPQVLVVIGFADMAAWQRYIASHDNQRIMRELRALGCTGFTTRVWMPSRLTPDPVHASDLPLARPAPAE